MMTIEQAGALFFLGCLLGILGSFALRILILRTSPASYTKKQLNGHISHTEQLLMDCETKGLKSQLVSVGWIQRQLAIVKNFKEVL